MKKIWSIAGWVVFFCVISLAATIGKQLGRELIGRPHFGQGEGSRPTLSDDDIQRQLAEGAEIAKKNAPQMVDQETRADGAVAGPGRRLTYLYTIVHYPSGDKGAASAIQSNAKPIVVRNACQKMLPIITAGVTVVFDYRGSDGHELTTFDVDQSTCASLAADSRARSELQTKLDSEELGRYKVLTAEEQAKLPPDAANSTTPDK